MNRHYDELGAYDVRLHGPSWVVDAALGRELGGHSHEEPEHNLREAWELGHSRHGASEVRTWEEELHHEGEA